MYLKQTMFLGYIVLQFILHVILFIVLNVLYVYISTFRSVCAVTNVGVFCSSLNS